MRSCDITLCAGVAGSGKSFLSVAEAVANLNAGLVKKIILTRPAVEAGEHLGHLPGDATEKVRPFLQPLFDALGAFLEPFQIEKMQAEGIIEVAPLAYLRGRSFNECFMVLDEAQNTTKAQMKMYLTRIGLKSRCVVVGDVSQVDLENGEQDGFSDAICRLQWRPGVGTVRMTVADLHRHPIVAEVIDAYEQVDIQTIEDAMESM